MIKRFKDIPRFPRSYYMIDIGLDYLPEWLERQENPGLDRYYGS